MPDSLANNSHQTKTSSNNKTAAESAVVVWFFTHVILAIWEAARGGLALI